MKKYDLTEEITDELILKLFISPCGHVNTIKVKHAPKKYIEYITNRYNDSDSIKETIYRIANHIEERPVCKVCGGHVPFFGKPAAGVIWGITCSHRCRSIYLQATKTNSIPKLENETEYEYKLRMQKNKERKDRKIRYDEQGLSFAERIAATKLEIYGDPHYVNHEKAQMTLFERTGCTNPGQLPTNCFKTNNPMKDPEILAKRTKTNNERYNGASPTSDPNVRKKQQDTYAQNHNGATGFFQTNEWKEYCYDAYGGLSPTLNENIRIKQEETYAKNHNGAKRYFCSNEWKERYKANKEKYEEIWYETKRRNNTLNSSKPEDRFYNDILKVFPDAKHNYKTKEYPFKCDIVIPSINLYIELNLHWTHGKHPFDVNSEEDQHILDVWKKKHTKFYDNAIEVWTIRDPNKVCVAKENNINLFVFYEIKQAYDFLETLK